MSDEIKMVSAKCTQCGGIVEVDKNEETAKCPYCGSTFLIEKAVNNYNVNIDVGGAVKDVLGFVGDRIKEGREERMEIKREEAQRNQAFQLAFLKIFVFMFIGMLVFGLIAFIIMNITG